MLLSLSDGTAVHVRPIAPEDKPLLVAGLRTCSPQTIHRRFLAPKTRFSAAELRYLTEVDGHDHIAYVALHDGALVAVARLVKTGPDFADVAIVVCDAWQGRGLGQQLTALLARRGAQEGVRWIGATMLVDNRPALRVMRGLGDFVRDHTSHGVREVVALLAA
ncbi:MAG TPA: GNAT family N-acetyltransferase [Solirubrobacter sp.]|nr:GNAT family N-acetyltransferase [Solirubrobacter sp.]